MWRTTITYCFIMPAIVLWPVLDLNFDLWGFRCSKRGVYPKKNIQIVPPIHKCLRLRRLHHEKTFVLVSKLWNFVAIIYYKTSSGL